MEIKFDHLRSTRYCLLRELQSEPAAIECAAAERRGSRVLVLARFNKTPLPTGGGVFLYLHPGWR